MFVVVVGGNLYDFSGKFDDFRGMLHRLRGMDAPELFYIVS